MRERMIHTLTTLKEVFSKGFDSENDYEDFIITVADNVDNDIKVYKLLEYKYILESFKGYEYLETFEQLESDEQIAIMINDFVQSAIDNGLNYITEHDFESWETLFNAIFTW